MSFLGRAASNPALCPIDDGERTPCEAPHVQERVRLNGLEIASLVIVS